MIRVFIFSPRALENGRGGEISSMELASGLKKFYKITFMDSNILTEKILLDQKTIYRRLKGVDLKRKLRYATLSTFDRNFSIPFPNEIMRLFRIIKQNDVIYTSVHNIKMCILFIFFSLLHRRGKFIIGYRKPLYSGKLFSLYNLKYRLSILLFSMFKKRIYHHTMSLSAKRFLVKFYGTERVFYIVHGIDLTKFMKETKKDSMHLTFIYIGYLDDVHKGVNVLLQAIEIFIKTYPDFNVKFEFCGMGPLVDNLKSLEKRYPNYIKFHGYVDNDLIPDYYKKGDVYLFSSRVEPFPRAIMEALGAGLVIICTKTIGSLELLKKQRFAFFIPHLSTENIKKKILEVYNLWKDNKKEFNTLQKMAKDFVFQNYSISVELDLFKKLIDNISIV